MQNVEVDIFCTSRDVRDAEIFIICIFRELQHGRGEVGRGGGGGGGCTTQKKASKASAAEDGRLKVL